MNAADELQDRLIAHQVWLLRFGGGLRNRLIGLLNEGDDALIGALRDELDSLAGLSINEAQKRADKIQAVVERITAQRLDTFDDVADSMLTELTDLAIHESDFSLEAIKIALPVELGLVEVPLEQIRAAVTSRPFQGKYLKEWADGLAENDRRRLSANITNGIIEGRTIEEMVTGVRGTRARKFKDGILEISRREAETSVRTAVNHVSNAARNDVFEANADIIEGVMWIATLDGRTSAICRARDGHIAPVGNHGDDLPEGFPLLIPKNVRPPAHPNCRSTTVAMFDIKGVADQVGDRPFVRDTRTRRQREKDFRAESKAAVGKGEWKKLSEKERRGLINDRKRTWTSENVGRVPSKTTYDEWLRRQPEKFQDEVLGKGKAGIFRKGKKLDKFVDKSGKELTLKELQSADGVKARPKAKLKTKKTPRKKPAASAAKPDASGEVRKKLKAKVPEIQPRHSGDSTNAFRNLVDATVNELPENILKDMSASGVTIRAGKRLTELRPDLKGVHPRGWPPGTTWDSAEGLASGPTALISEEFRPIGHRKFIKSERVPGVIRHEIGHAYDHAVGNPSVDLSQSAEFLSAYRKDKRAMNSIVRGNLRYFVQKGTHGPTEAFAEAFAVLHGGGAAQGSRLELFRRSFPNVLKEIERILKEGAK